MRSATILLNYSIYGRVSARISTTNNPIPTNNCIYSTLANVIIIFTAMTYMEDSTRKKKLGSLELNDSPCMA